ncbi:DUF2971 domain-containing protein [Herbaspirillum huttiense F1]|uniref:DUF2971 domain-containing protein n=1 Tax=Herbaspirillum huttiense TaxID=863372 RepID=UPI0028851D6E|nr:DUF2971 domain-containing protein [Herbaspirillum huttiense]MDT0358941.1 DUF2971 domain-containing protein [Herbaspirillum huttiense F1]
MTKFNTMKIRKYTTIILLKRLSRMLPNRIYTPKDGELLYHYCSPETMLALCSFKKLRFSDLFSMNDFMEVHWGYHIWEMAAGEVFPVVGKKFLDDIDAIIHESGIRVLPLAACLSKSGDVLSQWRAYGDDGRGFAVGFSPSILNNLPVTAFKVEYDKRTQIEEVKSFILALHTVESQTEAQRGPDFFDACATLACDLAAFKNPAFQEEQEVRLLHLLQFKSSNSSLKLIDPAASDGSSQEVKFRMKGCTPVAYLDMEFSGTSEGHSIVELIMGPKNDSLLSGISVFLETLGHPNVKVRKSAASYR